MREEQKMRQARRLRRAMTEAEKNLWYQLRGRRFFEAKFRRQYPLGSYIADFACVESRLIIEVDGSQHAAQKTYDEKREHYFRQQGFTVLRFWNNEVLSQMESVLTSIMEHIRSPHPDFAVTSFQQNPPSPVNGRGEQCAHPTERYA